MSNELLDIPELADVQLSPGVAVSSIALNFALKWFDLSMIKDGTLYQQKKMEGSNIVHVDISDVLDVARQFERHLLSSPNRLSTMMIDIVAEAVDLLPSEDADPEPATKEPTP